MASRSSANTAFLTRPPPPIIHPAPPIQPIPPRTFSHHGASQPRQHSYHDDFMRLGGERDRIAQQEEEIKNMNQKIITEAERMYGPDPQLTREMYEDVVRVVQMMEGEERNRHPPGQTVSRNGTSSDWLRSRAVNGTSASLSALPPPPPSSTSFPPSLYPPNTIDDLSRQSNHRSSSPRMYSAPTSQTSTLPPPPPPPPPFAGRTMLGPASPPYTAHPPPRARDSTIASSMGLSRDLPTPSTKSSMSISSMLGPDAAKPREPSGVRPNGTSYSLPPSVHNSNASSPTKPYQTNGFHPRGSPKTSQHSVPLSTNRFWTSSGGQASLAKASYKSDSPLYPKFMPSTDSITQISPRSDQGAPLDWRGPVDRRSDPGNFMQRPASQPNQPDAMLQESNRKHSALNSRVPQSEWYDMRTHDSMESQPEDPTQHLLRKRHAAEKYQAPLTPITGESNANNERPQASSYPFLSSKAVFAQSAATNHQSLSEISKPVYAGQSSIQKGPLGPEALKRIRDDRLGTVPPAQKPAPAEQKPGILDALSGKRSSNSPKYHPAVLDMERSESFDRIIQSVKEGESGHRNSLAQALLENNRRHGRLSPLPQAVQGAQSRSDGPSRDPSVKHEFSKMFAGIGSGVSSSGLAGSGTSTPFPPSPKQTEERISLGTRLDLDGTKSRTASRTANKRQRRVNDEAREREGSSRVSGEKGAKRMRHHHHPPGHHHHHHRHLDDQNSTPVRIIGDPVATNNHHHHHPDGTIHYHAHNHTKPSSTALTAKNPPPYRLPRITISNDRLLSRVSHLPRHHLGSVLYTPHTGESDSQAYLKRTPTTLSALQIEGKDNCTLTLRVPHLYLTTSERQKVCSRRLLWGAGVYTDDSDPLAAAIHSGWVLGAWPSDTNPTLLEPTTSPSRTVADAEESEDYTSQPPKPITPPTKRDLHLTILVLPALKEYPGMVHHGIKSRSWGHDHDGMSFMVMGMRFAVPSGTLQRGLKAKRERIARLVAMGVGGAANAKGGCGREVEFNFSGKKETAVASAIAS